MTERQERYRKGLIRSIHTSRRWREWFADHRDEYKEALRNAFGVESSTQLSIEQLVALDDWMNGRIDTLPRKRNDRISKRQLAKLRALWRSYARDQSDHALLGFVARVTTKRYLNPEMISKAEAQRCIAALERTVQRKKEQTDEEK